MKLDVLVHRKIVEIVVELRCGLCIYTIFHRLDVSLCDILAPSRRSR